MDRRSLIGACSSSGTGEARRMCRRLRRRAPCCGRCRANPSQIERTGAETPTRSSWEIGRGTPLSTLSQSLLRCRRAYAPYRRPYSRRYAERGRPDRWVLFVDCEDAVRRSSGGQECRAKHEKGAVQSTGPTQRGIDVPGLVCRGQHEDSVVGSAHPVELLEQLHDHTPHAPVASWRASVQARRPRRGTEHTAPAAWPTRTPRHRRSAMPSIGSSTSWSAMERNVASSRQQRHGQGRSCRTLEAHT